MGRVWWSRSALRKRGRRRRTPSHARGGPHGRSRRRGLACERGTRIAPWRHGIALRASSQSRLVSGRPTGGHHRRDRAPDAYARARRPCPARASRADRWVGKRPPPTGSRAMVDLDPEQRDVLLWILDEGSGEVVLAPVGGSEV